MSLSPVEAGYAVPTPADLQRFLGWPDLDQDQAESAQAHLDRAEAIVRAYVRGKGFLGTTMAAPLQQVVLGLAGRSLSNPTGDARVTAGQYSSSPGQPEFTLLDRLVLDGYRRRAA